MKKYDYVFMHNGVRWNVYGGLFEGDVNPQDLLDELWNDDSYYSGSDYCSNFEYAVVRAGDADFDDASYRVFRLPEGSGYSPKDFYEMKELEKVSDVEELDFRLNKRFLYDDDFDDAVAAEADPTVTAIVHELGETVH